MTEPPTLNREELADVVHREIGLPRPASAIAVEQVLDAIREALWSGEDVAIWNFGKFKVRDKAERVGRNPRNGVEVLIPPRRVVTFEPSPKLRARTAGK